MEITEDSSVSGNDLAMFYLDFGDPCFAAEGRAFAFFDDDVVKKNIIADLGFQRGVTAVFPDAQGESRIDSIGTGGETSFEGLPLFSDFESAQSGFYRFSVPECLAFAPQNSLNIGTGNCSADVDGKIISGIGAAFESAGFFIVGISTTDPD